MIEPAYHFCPRCGGALGVEQHEGQEFQVCSVCKETLYKNQHVTVDAVLVQNGKLLLVRRARDPQKGWLDFPGGFVNPDEKPADAVVREVREELHIDAHVVRLLGMWGPSPYPYKGVTHYNCGGYFLMQIDAGEPRPDDDVASIEWFSLEELPQPEEMAFTAQREFLLEVKEGKVSLSDTNSS